MFGGYGGEGGGKLAQGLVATVRPVVVDGHLVVARSVGAGEYWVALNNYVGLTINVLLSGAPTDFWPLDPVGLAFGSLGVNSQAPHPKAAELAVNFIVSRDAEQFLTKRGRLPTRTDVETNPPGVIDLLQQQKVILPISSSEQQKKMQSTFNE